MSEYEKQHSLPHRLLPWHAIPAAREIISIQVADRREWELASMPQVAPLGQRFSVFRAPNGYLHIFRYITVLGALRHPWATLEGLPTPRWKTEMMLKESTATVVDSSGMLKQPALVIKRVHIPYPLQRAGLATTLLRDVAQKLYPDWFIHGEAPSDDALAWHRHLNAIWPSRMLHFQDNHDDGSYTFRRISPGTPLDPQELNSI